MKPSKALTFCMLAFSYLIPSFSEGVEDERECLTSRATIRHKEPNGIGYNQGYSTLEVFGAPRYLSGVNILPFVDARLHLFNDGNPAVNGGIGARYLGEKFVWGINSYYDYRKTNHWHYNQYSLGLEMLGKRFDIRLNGYLPLGSKESKYYDKKFSYFENHYAIIARKKEFAMQGVNAEFGYHIKDLKKISLYGAAGPYYFTNHGKNAIGGEVRINATFLNHLKMELSGSYDPVFKWIGQGEAGLYISFGPKVKIKKKTNASSYTCDILAQRLTQPVDRQEIVVLDKYKKRSKAIDPSTNSPFYFVFVDNQSHSLGTYESPYTSIADAANASSPGDILYVYPGDGTPYDMESNGLTLKNNQKLFGSGTNQILATTAGNILIPKQTDTQPSIQSTENHSSIITLANSNEISGMSLIGLSSNFTGIQGGNPTLPEPQNTYITNANIHDNTISGTFTTAAINIAGAQDIFINNNISDILFTTLEETNGEITINCIADKANVQIINNIVRAKNPTVSYGITGISVQSWNNANVVTNIYGNDIHLINSITSGDNSYGIVAYSKEEGSSLTGTIANNVVVVEINGQGFSQGILAGAGDPSSYLDLLINNNEVFAVSNATNNGKAKAIGVDNSSQIGSHVKIIGNTAYAYGSGAIAPSGPDGIAAVQVKNNFEDDNSLFTADIFSNRVTVLGNDASFGISDAQIYGIYSNHTAYSGGLLSGTIALNKGVVLGTDATNISAAETVTVINNNIETNPSNPGTLPIPPEG